MSWGWVWSDERVLVNEGRREIRIDEERDLSARDDAECEMDAVGDGGGAGNGLSLCLCGVGGAECGVFQSAISCTRNFSARARSRSSSWSSSERTSA